MTDSLQQLQDIYDKLPDSVKEATSSKDGLCTRTVFKWSLVLFNVVFVILGAVTLGIGIFVRYDEEGLMGMLTEMPTDLTEDENLDIGGLLASASIILIAVGVLMFVIGLLGCVGAWKELKWFLVVYAVVIGIIFLLQVAAGVVAVLFRGRLEKNFVRFLLASIEEEYKDGIHQNGAEWVISTDATSMAWDLVQMSLECCGATGTENYRNATKWERGYTLGNDVLEAQVPVSCCRVENPDAFPDAMDSLVFEDIDRCLRDPPHTNFTNTRGCYAAITEWIESNSMIIVGIAIGIGGVEVLGLLFAYWLYQIIEKEEYEELPGDTLDQESNGAADVEAGGNGQADTAITDKPDTADGKTN